MAGETQEWKDMADSIMTAFGDVIIDATVSTVTQGSFDRDTGTYTDIETDIATRVKKTKKSIDFISKKGSISNEFEAYLVRGSDFTVAPEATDKFTVNGKTYLIDEVEDLGGIGALYRIMVRIK